MLSEMQQDRAKMLVRRKYNKYSKQKMTYLGLIAYVIKNAPEEKMTFSELMNAITIFVDGERRGLENNIRVCLSSNNCFVKVPKNPACPTPKRNFWKVDDSKITPKMLRRHFSALRDMFPDFYKAMEIKSAKNASENRATFPEAEKKFISSFSIESLLKRESSAPVRPLCAVTNFKKSAGDIGLECKRKTWDWPIEMACANLRRSHSQCLHPAYSWGQINYGYSPCGGPSKNMYSVSELSFCTSRESIRQGTSNVVTWAYV